MFISNVLQTKGSEVITVLSVDIVSAVVRKLADRHIGAVVVLDRWQKLVGILSERDVVMFLAVEGPDALGREVRELMTRPVVTCTAKDRIDDVLAMMTSRRIRHLPVLDGQQLAGLVSIGDLVHARLQEKTLEADVLRDLARVYSPV